MDVRRVMISLKPRVTKAWLAYGIGLIAAGLVMLYAWLTKQTGLPTYERPGFVAGAVVNLVVGAVWTAAAVACMHSRRWGRYVLEYTSWLLAATAVGGGVWVIARNGPGNLPLFVDISIMLTALAYSSLSGLVLHLNPVDPQDRGFPVILSEEGRM